MRTDILSGLKSAIEHGYSLGQAVQSLLNSGYNPQDVKEAADTLQGKVSSVSPQVAPYQTNPSTQATFSPSFAPAPQQPQPYSAPTLQQIAVPAPSNQKEAGKGIVISIIILLIIVLAGLGFTIYKYLSS